MAVPDMTSSRAIVFVVCNETQLETVLAVCRYLPAPEVRFLDLWSMSVVGNSSELSFPAHTPPLTLSRFWRALTFSEITPGDVWVIPQDVGVLEKVLAKRSKQCRATLVLMPDGIVGARARGNGGRVRRGIRAALYGALKLLRVVDGVPGRMGSSGPDVIFSWGSGWNSAFARTGSTKLLPVGSPRMDKYADLSASSAKRRLLVCSQPMHVPTWSAPYADQWYSFLETLSGASYDDLEVVIRLHPAERHDSRVPKSIRNLDSSADLLVQLEWADCVAAPFSTVLVDALAARRSFFVLVADDHFARSVSDIPLFSDARVHISHWNLASVASAIQQVADQQELREAYLANAHRAGKTAARHLSDLAHDDSSVART